MKLNELQTLIEPVVTHLGYELWGCEYLPQGKYALLRVYIDSEKGITVDDCAAVSRQLSTVLDVEEENMRQYTLEVSSPGLDRTLFTLEQHERYLDQLIHVRVTSPIEGRRKFTGVLNKVLDEQIELNVDDQSVLIDFNNIVKSHLCA